MSAPGRHETEDERLDRVWDDLLQELRVIQTGTQLLAGFLLTLPLQQRFGALDSAQRALYLVLVALAVLTTALVLAPVAVHRRLSGRHVKGRVVGSARRLLLAAMASMGLLIDGITVFVFDLVVGRPAAYLVGAVTAVVLLGLLVVLPTRLVRGSDPVR